VPSRGLPWCAILANPGSFLRCHTHWSAPPVSALARSRAPRARRACSLGAAASSVSGEQRQVRACAHAAGPRTRGASPPWVCSWVPTSRISARVVAGIMNMTTFNFFFLPPSFSAVSFPFVFFPLRIGPAQSDFFFRQQIKPNLPKITAGARAVHGAK